MTFTLLVAILLAALVASASPGPATITIATTSASQGARAGLACAAGVVVGSLTWSISAALGLSALMLTHGWVLEVVRYAGAAYLAFLAWKSAKAAWSAQIPHIEGSQRDTKTSTLFWKGLALHLTNPKAILFFGSLFAFVLKPGTPWQSLALVVAAVGLQSAIVFLGYALLFSRPKIRAAYARAARGIQAISALVFAGFAANLLTARLNT